MEENFKIKSFTQLKVWQQAYNLALDIYKISKSFPAEELYCLTSQMRRAVISISSNIAEGFTRNTKKDKIRFYQIALSSNTELQSQTLISLGLKYINKKDLDELITELISIAKLLNCLISKIKKSY